LRDVLALVAQEVVHDDDFIATGNEEIGNVRADEPGAAG
jgi:hypothetical protein